MANNYTLWSESIKLSDSGDVREAQKKWIVRALMPFDEWQGELSEGAEGSIEDFEAHLSQVGIADVRGCDDLEYWPGFSWELEDDHLWVYSEESGSIDNLAVFAQSFLKKFAPEAHFTLEWASSCSKPRLREFGGGAMVVTATEVLVENTSTMLAELLGKATASNRSND